jgi:hypothetical protein
MHRIRLIGGLHTFLLPLFFFRAFGLKAGDSLAVSMGW